MISIVVPVLNEAPRLPAMLDMLDAQPGEKQIILADGGSADETRVVAEGRALIVESQPGRARQMNAGAAHAEGESILFLHCDTRLPPGALRDVEDVMRAGDAAGGGFLHGFDRDDRFSRFISFSANTRTKTAKLFFGDQCIFIRREVFERMGGYADMPLFEDWDLSRRMREFGRTAIIETPVVTSGRRIDVWGKAQVSHHLVGAQHPLRAGRLRRSLKPVLRARARFVMSAFSGRPPCILAPKK